MLSGAQIIVQASLVGAPCGGRADVGDTVVPVNSDQLDKLGVVAHQSFVFWTRSNGRFGLGGRLVSDPCRPPVGDPRLAPSDRHPPALR